MGSAQGVPRQPGAQGFLDGPWVPHGADSVPGCPGLTGIRVQHDITVGGLQGQAGRARTQPGLGRASWAAEGGSQGVSAPRLFGAGLCFLP